MTRRYDIVLAGVTIVLVLCGLTFVYSASSYHDSMEGDSFYHLERQSLATLLGLGAMIALARTPYRRLARYMPHMAAAAVVGLLLVWMPGISHKANGATRWFRLGGMSFQPAEFVKMVAVVGMSWWMARNRGAVNDLRVLGLAAGAMVVPLLLIILQPDFGSFAIISGLSALVVVLAGLDLRWLVPLGGVGVIGLGGVALAEPYRIKRLTTFLDPFADCSGDGYQVCQSLLAFHHGGLQGQGFGGSVAKLSFLPEPHNDFIAAVYGEETGLIGVFVLLGLYVAFAWRGFVLARRAPDLFGALMSSTFTVMIAGQACLNLGVALAVVPPKGLVLPFMSYGASAMLVNLAAVGIMLSVSAEATAPVAAAEQAPSVPATGSTPVMGA